MSNSVKRVLTPNLNPTGLMALIGALYALGQGIWNAVHHHTAIDPQVIVAALAAVAAFYARTVVTPTADPRDGNGKPLTPPPAA